LSLRLFQPKPEPGSQAETIARLTQARKDPEPEPRNKEDGDSEEEDGDSLSHPVDVSPGCYNSGICLIAAMPGFQIAAK
jgi:hypothetical protein